MHVRRLRVYACLHAWLCIYAPSHTRDSARAKRNGVHARPHSDEGFFVQQGMSSRAHAHVFAYLILYAFGCRKARSQRFMPACRLSCVCGHACERGRVHVRARVRASTVVDKR
eukprot:6181832-Pleurochrysis_carterae.AAC.1